MRKVFLLFIFFIISNLAYADFRYDFIGVVEKSLNSDDMVARLMFKSESSDKFESFSTNPDADFKKEYNKYPERLSSYYFDKDGLIKKSLKVGKPYDYKNASDVGTYKANTNDDGLYLLLNSRKPEILKFKPIKPSLNFDELLSKNEELKNVIAPLIEKQETEYSNEILSYKIANRSFEIIILNFKFFEKENNKNLIFAFIKDQEELKKAFYYENLDYINLIYAMDFYNNSNIKLLLKGENDKNVLYSLFDLKTNKTESFIYAKP
ncbi:MAG: hypothetical protein BWY78_00924 [Alphaproteobacteria bacterium ADurb.Bin438]|nr:MAG: hypothetical protein BWY78_00924 [Alphaproteobacteria bacterium ADurb.Bin438]